MAKSNKKKVGLGVGLGLAGAAAAAAGYYFYASKDAAKNRKKAHKWAADLKTDVMKKAKAIEKLDEKAMKKIIGEASKAYESVASIDKKDLAAAAAELKGNWMEVKKEVEKAGVKSVKSAKKVAKKAVSVAKKATAKAPAKKAVKKVAKKK